MKSSSCIDRDRGRRLIRVMVGTTRRGVRGPRSSSVRCGGVDDPTWGPSRLVDISVRGNHLCGRSVVGGVGSRLGPSRQESLGSWSGHPGEEVRGVMSVEVDKGGQPVGTLALDEGRQ